MPPFIKPGQEPRRITPKCCRKISVACRNDLAMMWLAQLEHPNHRVIADFRKDHIKEIPGWMAQVRPSRGERGAIRQGTTQLHGPRIPSIMGTKTQGVQQAYNEQIMVDAAEGVIMGATLSAYPNDMQELSPTLQEVVENTGGRMFDESHRRRGLVFGRQYHGREAIRSGCLYCCQTGSIMRSNGIGIGH